MRVLFYSTQKLILSDRQTITKILSDIYGLSTYIYLNKFNFNKFLFERSVNVIVVGDRVTLIARQKDPYIKILYQLSEQYSIPLYYLFEDRK